MEKETKRILNLFLRYFILILIVIPGFEIFYFIFLPLTKYPVFYFLQMFFNPSLVGNTIQIGAKVIEISGACVAGSAYYLLLILNLATPKIKNLLRVKIILLSFVGFLIINLIRIILLSFMFLENSPIFDITHKILWYLGGTVVVIGIWFLGVWVFKINEIPFYSDLKNLYKKSILKK